MRHFVITTMPCMFHRKKGKGGKLSLWSSKFSAVVLFKDKKGSGSEHQIRSILICHFWEGQTLKYFERHNIRPISHLT